MVVTDKVSFHIEVVYAQAREAHVLSLKVAKGTTIKQAVEQSEILNRCPEIDLNNNKVGIFGNVRELDERVSDRDRIEVYRPLKADPKLALRTRAEQQKKSEL